MNKRIDKLITEIRLAALAALGLAGSLFTSPLQGVETRGIRNNNPGNIRKSSIQWQGAKGHDGSFIKFATPEDGIRAMARILTIYQTKYKLNTTRQIISRWSPASENATDKYINFVAKSLGKKPDDKIDFKNKKDFAKFISAIIKYENSKLPYSDKQIALGIQKANVNSKSKPT